MAIDTYSLKGFFAYGALADNDPNEVALLGELSVWSRTYSKDRLLFSVGSGGNPSTSVDTTIFSSKRADTDVQVPVPVPYASLLTDIARWCYVQATTGIFTSNPEVFRQQILTEYSGRIRDVQVGPMLQQGSIYLPEFVVFYFVPDAVSEDWGPERDYLDESRVKIWFSDDAFSRQFDEYEIEFIAPIPNLDDFFLLADQVTTRVNARTIPELTDQIREIAARNPYTILRSDNFTYHDPLAGSDYTLPTTWTFIIYGAGGNNIDAIKEALIEWILDNSTHTREEWAEIFPDIFTSTEFVVTPMWNQYAVPNMTLQEGVFSPTVNVQRALEIARVTSTGTNYTEAHVDEVLAVVGCTYKSLGLLVVGGPENRNGINRFERQWPDYMAVATTSIDFNRMQPDTQQWVMLLYQMLAVAEDMTEFSDIPLTMTRLRRTAPGGQTVLYLVSSYKNVQYLVVARSSLEALFPPETDEPLQLTCEGAEGVTSMPNGTGGVAYSTVFEALGGQGPYEYELLSSNNGPILSQTLDPVTGEYNATLAGGGGEAVVEVLVRDANQVEVTVEFSLFVIGS